MRAIFLLLLAANLGLFAWSNYYTAPDAASDPEPLRRQVSPEKIRLLAGSELAGLPALKPRAMTETARSALAAGKRTSVAGRPNRLGTTWPKRLTSHLRR